MKKTVLRLFYIFIFIVGITAISISSSASYAATPELSHQITSYEVGAYSNPDVGCKIKGFFEASATSLVKVTYTSIKISDEGEGQLISVDSENGDIFINGLAVGQDYVIEKDIVANVYSCAYPTDAKSKYVEVVAKQWCAFVFAVTYINVENIATTTYDSKIITCTAIDSGTPEVYRTGKWIKEADVIHYEIMIRSDKRKQTRSLDTGLKQFVVYKGTTEIDRVTNIGTTFYTYTLTVSLQDIAYYEINAVDNAGNQVLQRIAENKNKSGDAGFESAVKNALAYLEDSSVYAPSVKINLEKAYYDYYMAVQLENPNKEDAPKQADITREKDKTLTLLTEYARLKKLEQANKKECSLKIINDQYIAGEITLNNIDTALKNVLYGDKVAVNIILAVFEPSKVNKTTEMQVANVSNCKEIISLSILSTINSVDYQEEFYKPLQIAVPLKGYKNITGVATIAMEDGSYDTKLIDITEYNDYIVINSTYSYGTIDLFIDQSNNSSLLWLLTLIIPVGVLIFVTIKAVNKNKSKKVEGKNDKPRKKRGSSNRKTIDNKS